MIRCELCDSPKAMSTLATIVAEIGDNSGQKRRVAELSTTRLHVADVDGA